MGTTIASTFKCVPMFCVIIYQWPVRWSRECVRFGAPAQIRVVTWPLHALYIFQIQDMTVVYNICCCCSRRHRNIVIVYLMRAFFIKCAITSCFVWLYDYSRMYVIFIFIVVYSLRKDRKSLFIVFWQKTSASVWFARASVQFRNIV